MATNKSLSKHRINELRVAHHELLTLSPETNNKVYIQLSPGSVAMLTDRSVAQARVSRQLQRLCEEDERLESLDATKSTTQKL